MRAVVIGTGKIGCGYLAPMLRSAGWDLVLAARRPEVARRIQALPAYRVRITHSPVTIVDGSAPPSDATEVRGVDAVTIGTPAFDAAVANADLVCTAVGVGNVTGVAPALAGALARCPDRKPLDVWVVENDDCAGSLEAAVAAAAERSGGRLPAVGFAGGIATVAVGRGSWADPGIPEFVGDDATALVIDQTRTLMPIPALPGVRGTRHYRACLREKLYVFNAGHAVCGYLGWLRRHSTVPDAITDPFLRPMVIGCMLEARSAVVRAHPEIGDEIEGPVATALRRFADRELADPIVRVTRDPIRKLSPRDRLLGPVALIRSAVGTVPAYFSLSIAATLLYRHPSDAQAMELGRRLSENGVVSVLSEVCGLPPEDPLTETVADRYRGFIIDGQQTIFPPAHGRDLIGVRHAEGL